MKVLIEIVVFYMCFKLIFYFDGLILVGWVVFLIFIVFFCFTFRICFLLFIRVEEYNEVGSILFLKCLK